MAATVGLWEHFRRLLDFKGREDRASFWPYAALLYGIATVGSFLVMVPIMRSVMGAGAYQTAPAMPDMGMFVAGMMITTLAAVLLFAAAVVRRLHDGGLSGFWGLMPVPFLLFSMVKMWSFFNSFGSQHFKMDSFFQIFISNLIYILSVIALMVLLSRRSDPRSNRYGNGSAR